MDISKTVETRDKLQSLLEEVELDRQSVPSEEAKEELDEALDFIKYARDYFNHILNQK